MTSTGLIDTAPKSSINTSPPMSLVVILSLATFIIFFQGFMVAPILPQLAAVFQVSVRHVSFIEPSYLLGYGASTLIFASLSDKYGRFQIILCSLVSFILLTAITGFSQSVNQMMTLRLLTGIGAGGVAPTTIGWISDRFPFEKRGHALGIFFGCMAGGIAFGSSAGALLTAIVGWRVMFGLAALLGLLTLVLIAVNGKNLRHQNTHHADVGSMIASLKEVFLLPRGWRTYLFVLFNGMFHSGVFAWMGYFFYKNYHLDEKGVGLALLGYGIPGLLLGPLLGKLADRYGRRKIIPIGMAVGGLSAVFLGINVSLTASCLLVASLSLGFDLSHPLFAAIITTISPKKGAATGLFAFFVFMGYGFGSLLFSLIVNMGLNETLKLFGVAAILGALLSVWVFRNEK